MGFQLSQNDRRLLAGLHPDLERVIWRAAAISPIPFKVTEGLRSLEQQKRNVAKGVSWTLKSRHLTGHAVDIVPMVDVDGDGRVTAAEQYAWPIYFKLAPIIKRAAKDVGVPVEWGGDWTKNKDGPHWQLPWKQYPLAKEHPAEVAARVRMIDDAPPATGRTEKAVAVQKTVAVGASGAVGAGGIGGDAIADAANAVAGQQDALSSGDLVRIAIAVIIVGLTVFAIWRTWRK